MGEGQLHLSLLDAMYVGDDSCSVSEDDPGSWDETIEGSAAYKNRANGRKRKFYMSDPTGGDGSDGVEM
jgi:hypothetical protein